jgi:hypothetical protein
LTSPSCAAERDAWFLKMSDDADVVPASALGMSCYRSVIWRFLRITSPLTQSRVQRARRPQSFVRWSLLLTLTTILALVACSDPTAPEAGPVIDVVGRVTSPSGAPAAGVTVIGESHEAFLCDLPAPARNETTISTTSGADGMYRLRIRANTAGLHCVGISAQAVDSYADARRVADFRARGPFVVLRVDLPL